MPPTFSGPSQAVSPPELRRTLASAAPHRGQHRDRATSPGELTSEALGQDSADLLLDDPRDGMGAVAWLVGALFFAGVFGVAYLMATTWGVS